MTYLIDFNKYERFIYKQLSSMMHQIFIGYQQNDCVGQNFSQCLKMLLQLRRTMMMTRFTFFRLIFHVFRSMFLETCN